MISTIRTELKHIRNREIHLENIEKELKDTWTDIALYALACGIKDYERFAEYGARRLGYKPCEDEYLRLKEIGNEYIFLKG